MSPGRSCIAGGCHSAASKTPLTMAGTIYSTRNDVDDCNGVDGTTYAVVPVDMDGTTELTQRLFVNQAGNFWTSKVLPPSYKVKVIHAGRATVMMGAVTDGNCNACHSAEGAMQAAGRIVAPLP